MISGLDSFQFFQQKSIGVHFSKVYNNNNNATPLVMAFPDNIHPNIVDWHRAGSVYIVVLKRKGVVRKFAHHAILVDVAGASNGSQFHGVLIHLSANSRTRLTMIEVDDSPWDRDDFHEVFLVGGVPPTTIDTHLWANELKNVVRSFV